MIALGIAVTLVSLFIIWIGYRLWLLYNIRIDMCSTAAKLLSQARSKEDHPDPITWNLLKDFWLDAKSTMDQQKLF